MDTHSTRKEALIVILDNDDDELSNVNASVITPGAQAKHVPLQYAAALPLNSSQLPKQPHNSVSSRDSPNAPLSVRTPSESRSASDFGVSTWAFPTSPGQDRHTPSASVFKNERSVPFIKQSTVSSASIRRQYHSKEGNEAFGLSSSSSPFPRTMTKPLSMGLYEQSPRATRDNKRIRQSSVIDLDAVDDHNDEFHDQDYLNDDQFEALLTKYPEVKQDHSSVESPPSPPQRRRISTIPVIRNPPIVPPYISVDRCTSREPNPFILRPGITVELDDGDFLKVVVILKDCSSANIFLRGWRFRRTREMNGVLKKKLNEVCWILERDEDDPRNLIEQSTEQVSLTEVVRRRGLRMTNQDFPARSYRDDKDHSTEPEHIVRHLVLVCRWKYVSSYKSAKDRVNNRWCEKALHRLRGQDIDDNVRVEDETLRHIWRGATILGGACIGLTSEEREFFERERKLSQSFVMNRGRSPAESRINYFTKMPRTRSQSISINTRRNDKVNLISPTTCLPDSRAFSPILLDPPSPISEAQTSQRNRILEDALALAPSRLILDITGDEEPMVGFEPLALTGSEDDLWEIPQRLNRGELQTSDSGKKRLIRSTSPEVIKLEAMVKLSSKHGFSEKKFDGSITSTQRSTSESTFNTPKRVKHTSILTLRDSTSAELDLFNALSTTTSHRAEDTTKALRDIKSSTGSRASPAASSTQTISRQAGLAPHSSTPQYTSSRMQSPTTGSADIRRYTFGDAFCGAGGMSRGAKMAGLRVEWGFDYDPPACSAYMLNFHDTDVFNARADQFTNMSEDHKVDIMHLSPPCQYFSPAHTVEGKDDEMNTASLFAIFELLKKAKPRVVTLEQTSGLIERHEIYFNAVIPMFTDHGFSVRWKTFKCNELGAPQARSRLFVIASCPGEVLPEFPKPTHSANPEQTGLKPFVTVNDMIRDIPEGWANHDIESTTKYNRKPYNGDEPLQRCITTGGGENYHPSGRRDLTLREYACLQSFPWEHKFGKSGIKKQIGNAVPPVVGKLVLEAVKKALLKADGLDAD
ncbi:MAG: hypothetical protein M1827_001060 [Pycnora praestabilis]|nr:MAG: hypothetical protein M1827_001060 [Pycnora praestabilis]